MNLVIALLRRAAIDTPVADHQQEEANYVASRARRGDALPADITDLGYVRVAHNGRKVVVTHRDFGQVHVFRSDVEARAYILRVFW